MSKQRTSKLVTKIPMITCSSLVQIISDRVNNFMQNKCNKWMKYKKVLPNHRNANIGSSIQFIYMVDDPINKIDMQIQD